MYLRFFLHLSHACIHYKGDLFIGSDVRLHQKLALPDVHGRVSGHQSLTLTYTYTHFWYSGLLHTIMHSILILLTSVLELDLSYTINTIFSCMTYKVHFCTEKGETLFQSSFIVNCLLIFLCS